MTDMSTTYRDRVNALPHSFNDAIQSAMENAAELGLSEEAEDDGEAFWAEVLGQVTA